MVSVEYSAAVEASAERTWALIRQFGRIADWHPAIVHSVIEDGQAQDGINAIRRLELADGGRLRERLTTMDERRMALSYRFEESPLPLDHYEASVRVVRESDPARCILNWSASFEVRDAGTAAHFERLIKGLIVEGHNGLAGIHFIDGE
jgi:hypothetical protein